MQIKRLATSVNIAGKDCEFYADFRDIIDVLSALDDPNLTKPEKLIVALNLFYKTDDCMDDTNAAINEMFSFIAMDEDPEDSNKSSRPQSITPLYDWEQDFNIIVAPVNRILGYDVRSKDFVHWWTFLSAFMEIGECTFNTYVGIRNKLNCGRKLEKYEEKILKEHREEIILKKRVDDTTQSLMDEIMGV